MAFVATASSVAPLLIGHLVVPLLSEPANPPRWRSVIPALDVSAEALCFTYERLEGGRWWTMFTSVFVHLDQAHALANMAALIQSTNRVACQFGPVGVWSIFFGGHIVNCLSVRIARFEYVEKRKQELRFESSLLAGLNSYVSAITDKLAPHAHRYVLYAGSSCGVSALRGATFVLAARDFLTFDPMVMLQASMDMAFTVGFILGELRLFTDRQRDNVSHAGHVMGFVGGGVTALALCAGLHVWRHRKRRASCHDQPDG